MKKEITILEKYIRCRELFFKCHRKCKTCHFDVEDEEVIEAIKVLLKEVKDAKSK